MSKQAYKVVPHSGIPPSTDVPPEVLRQREELHARLNFATVVPVECPVPSSPVPFVPCRVEPELYPKMKQIKLTCKTLDFVLEIPVVAVDVQDRCINVQVMPDFSMGGSDKLQFALETDGQTYDVFFLGMMVRILNFHVIVFVKNPENV